MTFLRIIFCLLISIVTVSCTSVNLLTINVQKPAQITLPLNIANVAVVNNAVDQPVDIGHKYYQYGKEFGFIEVKADSVTTILSTALAQFLDEAQFYNKVSLYPYSLRNDLSFLQEKRIDEADILSICDNEDADVVLSLDRLLILLQSDREHLGDGLAMTSIGSKIQAKFSLYKKDGKPFGAPISHQDSLFWQEVSQGNYPLSDPLPTLEDAMKQSAIHMATMLEGYFVPHWEEQDRWFYSGAATRLKEAGLFATSNRWDEARAVWQSLYDIEKKPKTKAKLASNIALAYEVSDNLEKAFEWITVACDLLDTSSVSAEDQDFSRAQAYREALELRVQDFKTLDLQQGK